MVSPTSVNHSWPLFPYFLILITMQIIENVERYMDCRGCKLVYLWCKKRLHNQWPKYVWSFEVFTHSMIDEKVENRIPVTLGCQIERTDLTKILRTWNRIQRNIPLCVWLKLLAALQIMLDFSMNIFSANFIIDTLFLPILSEPVAIWKNDLTWSQTIPWAIKS